MPGYKDWIDAIDIDVDYFSAFMKAWIAFNAWYNNSGEVPPGSDKDCIEYISEKTNRFKTYTINLIEADSSEGNIFRENVAALHEALSAAAITTQEYLGTRLPISFANVAVKNSNNHDMTEFRNVSYECTRSRGKTKITATEIKTGKKVLDYEQDGYSEDDLLQQSDYKKLSNERQRKCIECFRKLKPYETISILAHGERNIPFGAYNFTDDPNRISSAIVIILYMLRCCLAHGDISPDAASKNVYCYAYEVLCAALKKLK